jgi:hypothetical protein
MLGLGNYSLGATQENERPSVALAAISQENEQPLLRDESQVSFFSE